MHMENMKTEKVEETNDEKANIHRNFTYIEKNKNSSQI